MYIEAIIVIKINEEDNWRKEKKFIMLYYLIMSLFQSHQFFLLKKYVVNYILHLLYSIVSSF